MKGMTRALACALAATMLSACGDNNAAAPDMAQTPAPSATAQGSGNACLMELSATVMGNRLDHLDCLEANSGSASELEEMCNDIAEMNSQLAAMGDEVEIHSQSTRRVASCPSSQARCEGVMNGRFTFHYGGREESELGEAKTMCEQTWGGRWRG